jgi:hypothetical protein
VRGDSVRDLYAKTLAVMGLGLLAGAGAVVDYWPVGGTMPAVRQAALPTPDAPVLAQNLDVQIPPPDFAPRPAPRPALRLGVGAKLFMAPAASIDTAASPAPAPPAPAPTPGWESLPVEVAIPESLTASFADMSVDMGFVATAPASDPDGDGPTGMIGGAIRKTKNSPLRTGAVTRSSLADALRGVVGAFKKVTPF